MAHFAEIDENNTVIKVVVVADADTADEDGTEVESIGVAFLQSMFGADTAWVQTSWNGRIRNRFTGPGATWDASRDAFIDPQPFPSWVLDEATTEWHPPTPRPDETRTGEHEGVEFEYPVLFQWDEDTTSWVEVD
jgi:hypothetical protein